MNSETQSFVPATRQAESKELTVDEVRESLSTTEKDNRLTPLEIAAQYFAKIRFCGAQSG